MRTNRISKLEAYWKIGRLSESENLSYTEFIVNNLMNGLFYKGRSIFIDNYYNSVTLSKNLLEKQTYVTRTLRSNRKYKPKDVIDKKLKKGVSIHRYSKEGICVLNWNDKRDSDDKF